jgi:HEAT repeat protein
MDEQPGQDAETGHSPEAETAGGPGPSQDERRTHYIRMLSDDDEVSRWKAAEVLGRMGDPESVNELISTLWDDDPRVRLKAAWALGRIGDRRGYAPLQRLYRMEDEWAQEIIKEALENIRHHMAVQ